MLKFLVLSYLIWRFLSFNVPITLAWYANAGTTAEIILRRRIIVYRFFALVYGAAATVLFPLPWYRMYFSEKVAELRNAIDQHQFALKYAENPSDFDGFEDLGDSVPANQPLR